MFRFGWVLVVALVLGLAGCRDDSSARLGGREDVQLIVRSFFDRLVR